MFSICLSPPSITLLLMPGDRTLKGMFFCVICPLSNSRLLSKTMGNGERCSLRCRPQEGAVSLVWSHVCVHTERKHFFEEYCVNAQPMYTTRARKDG